MNSTVALNFIRSAVAPVINAGVIINSTSAALTSIHALSPADCAAVTRWSSCANLSFNCFELSDFCAAVREAGEPEAGACCAGRGDAGNNRPIVKQQYNTARFITRSTPLRWNGTTGDGTSDMRHYTHSPHGANSEILIPSIHFSDAQSLRRAASAAKLLLFESLAARSGDASLH